MPTREPMEPGDLVQSNCRKCKKSTKHIIVGLVDGVPSKVQCTICKGNHNYRSDAEVKATGRPRPSPKNPMVIEWRTLSQNWDPGKASNYATTSTFKRGELVNHASFGLGVVREIAGSKKMVVLFEVGEKLMMCGN